MCGILCVAGSTVPKDTFEHALHGLKHRGPDGSGCLYDEDIMLGHRLLQIQTSEPVAQPVFNEDRSIVAVANGEIYDADELKQQLVKKGHRFHRGCDSELLVHLYEEHGVF